MRREVATSDTNTHTSGMTLKNAAVLAFLGTGLLTVLLIVELIEGVVSATQGLIPMMTVMASLARSFAGLAVTVFFYVFHKAQS